MDSFGQLMEQGTIERVESSFREPHGGDLNDFFVVRGERDKLAQVRASDAFGRVIPRASMVVQHIGGVSGTTGEELYRQLGEFQQDAADLA